MDYLYGRVMSVKIEPPVGNSKTFEHNIEEGKLFRIDFEVDFKGHATVSLYNVLDVTARMCEPATVGGKKKFASLTLEAGYTNDLSLLAKGEIIQSLVKRSGADKILEMKLSSKVSLLNEFVIPKEYNGSYRSIIPQILKDNGIS
ncbi:MAG TPA: hypothetical protein PLX69_24265, partial [Leptospiraceae bacterium]|nr:hypothetical protein [Leptospiraceae bacterium]